MSEFSFIKELEYKKFFNEQELRMINIVGIDKFLLVLEEFQKSSFYFSTDRVEVMKREYIIKNKKLGVRELSKITRFSEGHIYTILRNANQDNLELFEKEKQ